MYRKSHLIITIFIIFLMIPVYWLILMSFKTNAEIGGVLTFFPVAPTFAGYQTIYSDPAWYMGYFNAAAYVLLNVAMTILVAVPAAYAFSRYRFFADREIFFILLIFRMIAPPVLLIPMVQIFSELELIDTYIAVAIAHSIFNVPIAIWILEGFMSSIPLEIDESAKIDGYRLPGFFTRILLPLIAPGVAVTAFFCFMFSWVEFPMANALTTIHAKPIGSIMTRSAGVLSADLAQLAAAGTLTLIPGLLFVIFVRKHLARGFSMGRVV